LQEETSKRRRDTRGKKRKDRQKRLSTSLIICRRSIQDFKYRGGPIELSARRGESLGDWVLIVEEIIEAPHRFRPRGKQGDKPSADYGEGCQERQGMGISNTLSSGYLRRRASVERRQHGAEQEDGSGLQILDSRRGMSASEVFKVFKEESKCTGQCSRRNLVSGRRRRHLGTGRKRG